MVWFVAGLFALAIVIFFLFASPLGSGNGFRPTTEALARLRATAVLEEGEEKVFGRGSLKTWEGLSVLRLKGSPYEIGYQHGVLLREQIPSGAVPYFDQALDHIAPFREMKGLQRWLLRRYFDWTIFRPLLRNSPHSYVEELKGVADGSGLPFSVVFRGNQLSELTMNLGKRTRRQWAERLDALECTGFAASGQATTDGRLIVGRNTDYFGAGLWDRHHVVIFYEPDDGYRFVNVSSAGLLKCNSCLNEMGICLGGHFMYSDDVHPDGVSFTALELEIMKKADSIDAAFRLVTDSPRAGAFAYLVSDGKAGDAAVIEASANFAGLRRAKDGCVWQTNHATTDEFIPHDYRLRGGIARNSLARFRRMGQLLEEHRGRIDIHKAAAFMGDHFDPCSESLRPSGAIIGTLANVTSVVFCPSTFDFWVASGLSPVSNNTYHGMNLMDELSGGAVFVDPPQLEPNPYVESSDFALLRRYYDAAVSLSIPPLDLAAARTLILGLAQECPEEVGYQLVAARLLLREGNGQRARPYLEAAWRCHLSSNERAQVQLLLGFACDLEEDRPGALECYRAVQEISAEADHDPLKRQNPFVLADATTHITTPFGPRDAAKVEISPMMSTLYDM